MTCKVVVVNEGPPIEVIVRLFDENQIKRVPVVCGDHVVGIVSRADLLRAFASQATQEAAKISDSDRDIQSRILADLERQPWWHKRNCGIVVSDGIAHLGARRRARSSARPCASSRRVRPVFAM